LPKLRKSDLAFGVNFSPAQLSLPRVLQLVEAHRGTTEGFTEAIRTEYFDKHANGDRAAQIDIAKNVRLSLRAYGVVGNDEQFTDLGKVLNSARADPVTLYSVLAKQIILNLHGIDLIRAISHLQQLRVEPTLQAIAKELEVGGVHVPPSAVHISSMKQWLQLAGVLDDRLEVNDHRLRELIGYGLEEVNELDTFSPELRAYVRALAALDPRGPTPSSRVREHATAMSHIEFDLKNLREQVLYPLRDLGYITVTKSTSGRGAKAHLIEVTPKFRVEFITPILEALARSGGVPAVRLDRPLSEVLTELQSRDRHKKGIALELLAMHLCRLLGLRVTAWRRRARDTGGAEVDLLAEGTNYVFSRWQIQCKNTGKVSHDDVAREVGLLRNTRSNVIMLVTTGKFAKPAIDFAEQEMQGSPVTIVPLDGSDLKTIVRDPSSIGAVLRKHAQRAMRLKALGP
jgi:hypothetical protein